ncbi:MAG: hypothetical protein OXU71_01645 [Gammaproteobacteria bacterium]|nr:hypothetical protein [Gammaproteobacteria bacterium]
MAPAESYGPTQTTLSWVCFLHAQKIVPASAVLHFVARQSADRGTAMKIKNAITDRAIAVHSNGS